MEILANHQLGNSVAELSTQEHQPAETKADKSTESLVDDKLTESSVSKSSDWKKSEWKDWSKSHRPLQSWGSCGTGWSSYSWQENDNSAKKQKTDNAAYKETAWRKRQAVSYTTHYRGILTVISSFPVDYYCTNKGNYVSPALTWGSTDPTTFYPIPICWSMERHILRLFEVSRSRTSTRPTTTSQMSGKSTRRSTRRTIADAPAQLSKINSSLLHGQMLSMRPGRTRSRRRMHCSSRFATRSTKQTPSIMVTSSSLISVRRRMLIAQARKIRPPRMQRNGTSRARPTTRRSRLKRTHRKPSPLMEDSPSRSSGRRTPILFQKKIADPHRDSS